MKRVKTFHHSIYFLLSKIFFLREEIQQVEMHFVEFTYNNNNNNGSFKIKGNTRIHYYLMESSF